MQLADPSYPPLNGRCFLLELPAELRNMIYEYALSHDEGVLALYTPTGFTFHVNRKPYRVIANTLRQVSLQLYADTHRMVVHLNDIAFRTSHRQEGLHKSEDMAVALARQFLNLFPRMLYSQIRKINIYHNPLASFRGDPYAISGIKKMIAEDTQLANFCRQNPSITVIVRFMHKVLYMYLNAPLYWIGLHHAIHQTLRAEKPFLDFAGRIYLRSGHVPHILLNGVHCPSNLRFTLTHEFPLNRGALELFYHQHQGLFKKEEIANVLVATQKMFDGGI